MSSIVKLPDSWNTDDENPVRAARELFKVLGKHSAFVLKRNLWFVIRYLNGDKDKFGVNSIGETRELYPWQRQVEILAWGRHFGECLWYLRNGHVRAMVGKGIRPVQEPGTREWIGFVDHNGKPLEGLGVPVPGLETPPAPSSSSS